MASGESGLWKPALPRGKEHQDCVCSRSSLGFVLGFLSPREQLFCSPEITEIQGTSIQHRAGPPHQRALGSSGHGVIGPWSRRPFTGLVPEGWGELGSYSVSWTLYSEQRDLLGHCVEMATKQQDGRGGWVGAHPCKQRGPRIPKDLGSLLISAAGSY